jgi:sortase B
VTLLYSGYRAWGILGNYEDEAAMHDAVMEYKPEPREVINQSVIDLQAKFPDVVGWLTVPGTKIDYPFVWYKDNDHYLRRDLNGETATVGTLFMDYRCEKDFTSRNTIVYGHHMKNGSMFGTLKAFADKGFFEANRYGTIYLPRETLALEFFAYLVVKSTDTEIYSAAPSENYLEYVRRNARQYRDIGLTGGGRIITLSTCSYEFDGARMVLLAKVA